MTEAEELAYIRGRRSFASEMISAAARELVVSDVEITAASLLVEREQTRQALRDLCDREADNDWPDDLNLADVINKHLAPGIERYRGQM